MGELRVIVKSCTNLVHAVEDDFHEQTKQFCNSPILVNYEVLPNSPKEGTHIVLVMMRMGLWFLAQPCYHSLMGQTRDKAHQFRLTGWSEELVETNIEQSFSLSPSDFMASRGSIKAESCP
ncbi:hypothetical protein VNO78_21323 [Psophocarpus tetragonolobus]|uniref:Uncharacterized protein n=1 Tax=Psophocarpus tetragonolobus TaxID=3891 RepID=A0AAN9XIA0_PSOTE